MLLVPDPITFMAWAESMDALSYYAVLRVPPSASPEAIKAAFHDLALRCHPDRYVDDGPEVGSAAAHVFKRAVEAYNILSKPDLRIRYDVTLASGKLRMNPEDALPEKPKPEVRTLEMIAMTESAKKHARKADRLLAVGDLEAARIALVDATREDHGNDELKERLRWIYEAIAMT